MPLLVGSSSTFSAFATDHPDIQALGEASPSTGNSKAIAASACFCAPVDSRRSWSMAQFRAVEMIQPAGLGGTR